MPWTSRYKAMEENDSLSELFHKNKSLGWNVITFWWVALGWFITSSFQLSCNFRSFTRFPIRCSRFLFVAQHDKGVVVHAVIVRRARRERQEIRLVDLIDFCHSTCCIWFRVKHSGHANNAPAETNPLYDHDAHQDLEIQWQDVLNSIIQLTVATSLFTF